MHPFLFSEAAQHGLCCGSASSHEVSHEIALSPVSQPQHYRLNRAACLQFVSFSICRAQAAAGGGEGSSSGQENSGAARYSSTSEPSSSSDDEAAVGFPTAHAGNSSETDHDAAEDPVSLLRTGALEGNVAADADFPGGGIAPDIGGGGSSGRGRGVVDRGVVLRASHGDKRRNRRMKAEKLAAKQGARCAMQCAPGPYMEGSLQICLGSGSGAGAV